MEKVVIIGSKYDAEEVNKYLDQGWSVKNIHSATTSNETTIVFVLEKK